MLGGPFRRPGSASHAEASAPKESCSHNRVLTEAFRLNVADTELLAGLNLAVGPEKLDVSYIKSCYIGLTIVIKVGSFYVEGCPPYTRELRLIAELLTANNHKRGREG